MVRKGDDTNAFGFGFLTVNVNGIEDYQVSKAELRIGILTKTFENPEFPLDVSLDKEETMKLNTCNGNDCYLAIYDVEGKKLTLDGTLRFNAKPKVV